MEYTASHLLPDLELAVGPYEAASVRLPGPIPVNVEFVHEPGYEGRFPSADDPGEPGVSAEFDFKRILVPHSLVLTSSDNMLRLIVSSGTDLYPLLTERELQSIEGALLARHQASGAQARMDAAEIARFINMSTLG